jgi:protein TonB
MTMNAKHRRLPITVKTNKKKRSGFKFFSSNQTLYLTFLLSLLVHLGALYSIPSANLFSNSANADVENMIELDLLDAENISLSDDLALSEEQEHQFQAATPEIPWDWNENERAGETDEEIEADDTEFAPAPRIAELKDDYTLLSETPDQKPDIQEMLAQKQDPEELLSRAFRSRPPELEKPSTEQLRPSPVAQAENTAEDRPAPRPLFEDSPQLRPDIPENPFTFPRQLSQIEERQEPRLAEKKLSRPALDERNIQEPPRLAVTRPESSTLQERRLGLLRQDEDDKNRFGIFAGERFEAPGFQEAQQLPETEKQDAEEQDEVTREAESLRAEDEIEGPIRGRAIIYRPRPPQIGSISDEIELRLRFWVLPDGTIGEVIPMKRGNAQLEQIAIGYLKKWQFEPLLPDAPQKQIWGTIPIRFAVQ